MLLQRKSWEFDGLKVGIYNAPKNTTVDKI